MPKAQRRSNAFPKRTGAKGHGDPGAREPSPELLKPTGGCSHARGTHALQTGLQVILETGLMMPELSQHRLPERDMPRRYAARRVPYIDLAG